MTTACWTRPRASSTWRTAASWRRGLQPRHPRRRTVQGREMSVTSALKLLMELGLRNIVAHRLKSLIVGALLSFGAFLFVLGTAMQGSVERAMQTSIVSSVSGHLQVFDKDAKDSLALIG